MKSKDESNRLQEEKLRKIDAQLKDAGYTVKAKGHILDEIDGSELIIGDHLVSVYEPEPEREVGDLVNEFFKILKAITTDPKLGKSQKIRELCDKIEQLYYELAKEISNVTSE
jgi:hypothetical protein